MYRSYIELPASPASLVRQIMVLDKYKMAVHQCIKSYCLSNLVNKVSIFAYCLCILVNKGLIFACCLCILVHKDSIFASIFPVKIVHIHWRVKKCVMVVVLISRKASYFGRSHSITIPAFHDQIQCLLSYLNLGFQKIWRLTEYILIQYNTIARTKISYIDIYIYKHVSKEMKVTWTSRHDWRWRLIQIAWIASFLQLCLN